MNRTMHRHIVLLIVALAVSVASYGQKFPERRHIREGNGLYEKQRFADAEKSYRRALQKDSLSVEGAFNLGDTHYATENFAAAEEQFRKVAERKEEGVSDAQRAAAYFNLGNAQFQQQKLDEALESYKQSLKLNPSDLEAKFNYAYTKAMKDQQDQNQQNQNNQNNNQDQQQQNKNNQQQNDQNQQNNQDQQQGKNDQQQQQQPEEPQGNKPKPSEQGEQQQPQAGPSKENEQLLNAVQAAEDKTRDKVDAEKVVGVARSGKNW